MLLLDCRVPTRYAEKWGSCHDGNLEICARGEMDQNADKDILEGEACDFTDNLVSQIQSFVKNIDEPCPGYRGFHAPLSISQLLRFNSELCENPKRIFNKRTKKGDTTHVARFCIKPDHVRATKKITFHMKTIQDVPEVQDEEAEPILQPEAEDEGYEEGAEDSASQEPSRENSQAVSDVSSSGAGGLFMDCS